MSDDALNLMLESAFFGNRLVPWVEDETGETWLGNQAILVLGRLELEGDQRIGSLAAYTGVTSPRISQLVGELAEAGFVEVFPDPEDGRGRVVRLTGEGRRYIRTVGEGIQMGMEKKSNHVVHYWEVLSDFVGKYLD